MDDKINMMIVVSAHRSAVHPRCMTSILDAGRVLSSNKIQFRVSTVEQNNPALIYDLFASLVVQDATFTHVLFLDGDIRFGPGTFLRMLKTAMPMVGLACPHRQSEPRFAVTFQDRKETPVTNGLVEVKGIGLAATLIRRSVFETMIEKQIVFSSKLAPPTAPALTGPLYNFFHPICTRERRLSEDASFGVRWREQCGGRIYALIDEDVGHFGDHEFKGRLSDHLTFSQPEDKAPAAPKAKPSRQRN
jgi:hypothetical protein